MPPRYKFTKEEIVSAAFTLARREGLEAVTARGVGTLLGASSKVVFGSFPNMDALRREVIRRAEAFHGDTMRRAAEQAEGPPYKASGMAYIRFAREERKLFEMLFMRSRAGEPVSPQEDRQRCAPMVDLICRSTGLEPEHAYLLHLEMWIFVHGIAVMIATSYLEWNEEFIDAALTDCYLGLKHRFCREENHGSDSN